MDTIAEGGAGRRETPTEAERAAARAHAGGYLYRLDPGCDPNGAVPPEKIQGAWKVDAAGNIVGEFERNPRHPNNAQ